MGRRSLKLDGVDDTLEGIVRRKRTNDIKDIFDKIEEDLK
jgi:hypothetical protein